MTLWGVAFEDFRDRQCETDGRNFVDEYLRRRGWNESAPAKAYVRGSRDSIRSLYQASASAIVPGERVLPGARSVPQLTRCGQQELDDVLLHKRTIIISNEVISEFSIATINCDIGIDGCQAPLKSTSIAGAVICLSSTARSAVGFWSRAARGSCAGSAMIATSSAFRTAIWSSALSIRMRTPILTPMCGRNKNEAA
jgi:hypothetical protein